ncbi:MAG: putative peptidase [Candidatus Krumholzibacteriia bacterium]|jgi:predicted peptidase
MNHLNIVALIAVTLSIGYSENKIEPADNQQNHEMTPTMNDAIGADILDQTFELNSGDEIRYSILIPDNYDPETPKPLIVALHYGGEVTPHFARGLIEKLIAPGLHELNAIILAPDSIAGPWTNEKNESMVLELMDFICEKHNIDQEQTLLTGFSMGGHGTWYIGSRNQDRFSAMIPIAGYPLVEEDVKWATPVYAIHSTADTVVPIEATDEFVTAQREQGNEQIRLVTVDDLPHYQTGGFAVPLKNTVPWVKKIWGIEPIDN